MDEAIAITGMGVVRAQGVGVAGTWEGNVAGRGVLPPVGAVGEGLAAGGLARRLEGLRVGVFLATTVCGMDQNERFYAQYRENREAADLDLLRRVQPYEVGELVKRWYRAGGEAGLRQVCLS